jgi:hypothetical protein
MGSCDHSYSHLYADGPIEGAWCVVFPVFGTTVSFGTKISVSASASRGSPGEENDKGFVIKTYCSCHSPVSDLFDRYY